MAEEERDSATPKSCNKRIKEEKNKKKRLLNEKEEVHKERSATNGNSISNEASAENGRKNRKKCLLMEARKEEATQEVNREIFPVEEEQEVNRTGMLVEQNGELDGENADSRKSKKTKGLLKEAGAADKRGVCYLSRIPPHMDPVKLRQILSQYGEIQRIYLTPENPAAQFHRKRAGKFQQQVFSEGWVEFTDKKVAKRVANMLNGEQIGGRKRSSFYYDLWNIKYLNKFKWDDLIAEIAYKSAIREQKLALEISAAKKERDFYLSKVDQSHALTSIEERRLKKQKLQQGSGTNAEPPAGQQVAKVIRHFPQNQPVADNEGQAKPRLSKAILGGVFGGS
ncbi:Pre-rRNA-processing protein esf2 [Morella rubra]|uniref:Pre-rRNA-processing protein esf2 n=1 Tax=Morella rubra TaxID=262757 RepID=A0A6A1WHR8_9ROSI|nr:Pre-rRNA-processing protein esf2 [Morella rubra]